MSFFPSIVTYLYVSCNGSITSVGEERANLSAIVYLYYVVSVRRGCLFLLVLGWAALFYCETRCAFHNYFESCLLAKLCCYFQAVWLCT